jgi:hypothetical protein
MSKTNNNGYGYHRSCGEATMRTSKTRFGTLLIVCLIAAWPTSAEPSCQESKQRDDDAVAVDLKITVEGKDSLPEGSKIELRGLDPCDASVSAPINAGGQAKFSRVPVCKVLFKILIPGLNTGIVQVDLAKYKSEAIKIHMDSSGPANATILNPH